jgi:hypothetical protein
MITPYALAAMLLAFKEEARTLHLFTSWDGSALREGLKEPASAAYSPVEAISWAIDSGVATHPESSLQIGEGESAAGWFVCERSGVPLLIQEFDEPISFGKMGGFVDITPSVNLKAKSKRRSS